jgi:hypothetical protein
MTSDEKLKVRKMKRQMIETTRCSACNRDSQVTNFSRKPLQSAMIEKHPSKGCKTIQRKLQANDTGHAIKKRRISPVNHKKLSGRN